MKPVDRELLHSLLDEFIDAQHRLAGCNDMNALEDSAINAMGALQNFMREAAKDMLSERYACAGYTGREFCPAEYSRDAQAFAAEPCAPWDDMRQEEAVVRRRQLRQFIWDFREFFPEGLALAAAMSLTRLNLGLDSALLVKAKVKGRKTADREEESLDIVRATIVGYLIGYGGYRDETGRQKAQLYAECIGGMSWENFWLRMKRANVLGIFESQMSKGEADRAAKKPCEPGIDAWHELQAYVALGRWKAE